MKAHLVRGITLIEVLAVIVLVVICVALALPYFSARRDPSPMQWRTQLRGIHQGLVIHANSNKGYYPGFDPDGNALVNSAETTGESGDGTTVEARVWILLEEDMITPEYLIHPRETSGNIQEHGWENMQMSPVTNNHYSFALLEIDAEGERKAEWRETLHSAAIVISDRNTGTASNAASVIDEDHWRGQVVWNDNHTEFMQEPFVRARYGTKASKLDWDQIQQLEPDDYLFEAASGDDAYLIHSGR